MKILRFCAAFILIAAAILAMAAGFLTPHDYAAQFRDHANEPPSRTFLMGTDELGRDRFSRLLYGARVSLLLALATALMSLAIGAAVGLAAGYLGGWPDRLASGGIDLLLSLPWLFLLLTLRAFVPLNTSPAASLLVTFLLLGLVGWASGARVVRASVTGLRNSPPVLHARASGCRNWQLIRFHILPSLRPVLAAQFWILVPVFLLTEVNLGLLGLGVAEPMPSWGNMLSELQNYQRIGEAPWILAPAVLLVLVVSSLHITLSGTKTWE